ncbi:hypothetical protein [Microbacterium suaedae]|uniref:hypothetical protein n=1 Tax=Microbacterium suaedae TaxID=2067813 RepID=UPI0013A62F92|nr:hypothetical protein [Microbacterium suaedae]
MPNETANVPPTGDATAGPGDRAIAAASVLPEGARLLHIGQPDAAVVDIRKAAAARREVLLENGVVYPGADLDHSAATSALIGPSSPAWRANRTLAVWDALRSEIEMHPRKRALISDEHIAACDDDAARRFADELGGRLHVVITARRPGSLLPWLWQQRVLSGHAGPYAKWLSRAVELEDRSDKRRSVVPEEYDLATQIVRWTRIIGPAQVHVVLADADNPAVVPDMFETMLGLPAGLLQPDALNENDVPRALTSAETGLVRRVNRAARRAGVRRDAYDRVIRNGAVAALRGHGDSGDCSGPLVVPPKYAAQLASKARTFVDAAVANGIDVVGAGDHFQSPTAAPAASRLSAEDRVAMAVSMLRGAVSAALGRGVDFDRAAPDPHPLGQEARDARRGRDVLHIDLSFTRVIDRIRPSTPRAGAPALVGGVARVVASSRTARWVGVEGYALIDPGLRECVFRALNDPMVIITADADAERALWEQALALGETRGFPDWSVDGDALFAAIADQTADFSVIRSDDEDAIRKTLQDHPAPLRLAPGNSHPLKQPDLLLIRELNESLADTFLRPFERLAVIGTGAMGGMRARRSGDTNRPDSMARAIAGIAAMVGDHLL